MTEETSKEELIEFFFQQAQPMADEHEKNLRHIYEVIKQISSGGNLKQLPLFQQEARQLEQKIAEYRSRDYWGQQYEIYYSSVK